MKIPFCISLKFNRNRVLLFIQVTNSSYNIDRVIIVYRLLSKKVINTGKVLRIVPFVEVQPFPRVSITTVYYLRVLSSKIYLRTTGRRTGLFNITSSERQTELRDSETPFHDLRVSTLFHL